MAGSDHAVLVASRHHALISLLRTSLPLVPSMSLYVSRRQNANVLDRSRRSFDLQDRLEDLHRRRRG
jgi:hypothetical protein